MGPMAGSMPTPMGMGAGMGPMGMGPMGVPMMGGMRSGPMGSPMGMGGKRQPEARPGDWDCPRCYNLNFSSRLLTYTGTVYKYNLWLLKISVINYRCR